ncbi:hypothetical protein SAMD00019534_126430 [Acytostelium subglobosum LB1]|uniref:hypothetical protein n=1 Tax=Acytostelium subglobosum LB1 TaxID=1410327 RepID=UPI00064518A0|nr:hypothetical protein SAMD00019534_126430 [Acytostelium subglobosum LB1]GAM29467.1 hypothetical protein SAMD00019534_126430 [Acytostelium subglobosum LB1]|eukprot:XP_012747586.1 hypothetical protein SAMD00019534_126430 [Acytostelium subglobosum LB1]
MKSTFGLPAQECDGTIVICSATNVIGLSLTNGASWVDLDVSPFTKLSTLSLNGEIKLAAQFWTTPLASFTSLICSDNCLKDLTNIDGTNFPALTTLSLGVVSNATIDSNIFSTPLSNFAIVSASSPFVLPAVTSSNSYLKSLAVSMTASSIPDSYTSMFTKLQTLTIYSTNVFPFDSFDKFTSNYKNTVLTIQSGPNTAVVAIPSSLLKSTISKLVIKGDVFSASSTLDFSKSSITSLFMVSCTTLFSGLVYPGIKYSPNMNLKLRMISAAQFAKIDITGLTSLDVSENEFSSTFDQLNVTASELANIGTINMDNCNISGSLPQYLCQVKPMTRLILTNNKLSGNLPTCFLCEIEYYGYGFEGNNFDNFAGQSPNLVGVPQSVCPTLVINAQVISSPTTGGFITVTGFDLGWEVQAASVASPDAEIVVPNLSFRFPVEAGIGQGFVYVYTFHQSMNRTIQWSYQAPIITAFSRVDSGVFGYITGSNFGTALKNVTLLVNGVAVKVANVEETRIVLGAESFPTQDTIYNVTVIVGGQSTSANITVGNPSTTGTTSTTSTSTTSTTTASTSTTTVSPTSTTTISTTTGPSSGSIISTNILSILVCSILLLLLS